MTLNDILTQVTRVTYLLIAAVTLFSFVIQRNRTRLDIALMFMSFAITVAIQEYSVIVGPPPRWVTQISQVALMSQPYLLLRLVAHFRPVARPVQWGALGGLLVSMAVIFLAASPMPAWAGLLLVAYFAWVGGYSALAFLRGALTTGGVTRWRYGLAALGSGLVAAVILLAGVNIAAPQLASLTTAANQLMGVVSGLAYYFAFAPPRWLRQVWQLGELHRFMQASTGKPARLRAALSLPFLCETAQRALGGRAALAAVSASGELPLTIQAATLPRLMDDQVAVSGGAIGRAWVDHRPVVANRPAEFSTEGARLAAIVGAEALCAVPISTLERRWGLLVVLLQRRPLFPEDDLELMRLLSEQAALALDQQALLDEQQALVQNLRERSSQLEAANQELEAFSYSVSHDLRAPLRHIEGFTDLLLRGDTTDGQRVHLERISAAAVRMGRLIDDLLTFSRMGRTELNRQPVRLDRLVDEARQELQAEADGRAVEWRLHPLPEVQGDPDLLQLVVVNLSPMR